MNTSLKPVTHSGKCWNHQHTAWNFIAAYGLGAAISQIRLRHIRRWMCGTYVNGVFLRAGANRRHFFFQVFFVSKMWWCNKVFMGPGRFDQLTETCRKNPTLISRQTDFMVPSYDPKANT